MMPFQRHSATLMDHFQSPNNRRCLAQADAVGVAGVPGQGPYVVLYLRIRGDRITEASFQCNGCGVTIAFGSMLTELIAGRTLSECRELTPQMLIDRFDEVPVHKRDRAAYVLSALRDVLGEAGSFD